MLAANEVLGAKALTANKAGDVEGGDRSKYVKPKTGKLKSQKSAKSQKLSKLRK